MAASTVLDIDDKAVQRMLRGVDLAATKPAPAWEESAQYMRVRTSGMFRHLRSGGTYRGVTWKPFAPQYTRKDGTVVPAYGGVARVRAGWRKAGTDDAARPGKRSTGVRMNRVTGVVSGRLRPSGKRVTRSSGLMQDTMHLRSATATMVRRGNDHTMILEPQGVRYAKRQNELRRFLFFDVPTDAKAIGKIFAAHVAKHAKTGTGSTYGLAAGA